MNFDRITSDDLSTLRIDNKKISQYSVKCIDNDKIIAYIILQDIPISDGLFIPKHPRSNRHIWKELKEYPSYKLYKVNIKNLDEKTLDIFFDYMVRLLPQDACIWVDISNKDMRESVDKIGYFSKIVVKQKPNFRFFDAFIYLC
jgi:formylmethanofuran dehydrogenase subunit D